MALFKIGGMRLIEDMLPTAIRAEKLEAQIREKTAELNNLKSFYEKWKKGKYQ